MNIGKHFWWETRLDSFDKWLESSSTWPDSFQSQAAENILFTLALC